MVYCALYLKTSLEVTQVILLTFYQPNVGRVGKCNPPIYFKEGEYFLIFLITQVFNTCKRMLCFIFKGLLGGD